MSPEQNAPDPEIENLKMEVQRKSVDELKKQLLDSVADAQAVIDDDTDQLAVDALPNHEGSPNDPNTIRGKAETSKKAVQSILLAAGDAAPRVPSPDNVPATQLASATDFAKEAISNIAKKVQPGMVTEGGAPYMHRIMAGLLDGTVTDLQTLSLRHQQIRRQMENTSPQLYREMRQGLLDLAQDRGIRGQQAQRLFETEREFETRTMGKVRENQNDSRIIDLLKVDPDAVDLDCIKLYQSLDTAQGFQDYYSDLYREKSRSFEKTNPTATEEEKKDMAAELATNQIHRALIFMVNKFYKPVLVAAPDKDFNKTVSEFGDFYTPSPDNMFKQLQRKLTYISSRGAAQITNEEPIFKAFRQKRTTYYDPVQRQEITTTVPSKELELCGFGEFSEQLRKIIGTEQGFISYGFNFRYATNSGGDPEKGFFNAIAQYAKDNLKSGDIDEINTMPYNELVQAAKLQMEPRYKLAFSRNGWKKSESEFRQIFETTSQVDKEIRDTFIAAYGGKGPGKYSETIIDRCLFHARTELFGMNFMLHLMASYADPRLEKNGRPTYAGEEFAGASAFNASYDAIRWDVDDLNNNYELFIPLKHDEHYDDMQDRIAQGRQEFSESFQFGYAAFKDEPPAITEIANICKTGGVDAQGGWRVRMAYDNWLEDLLDDRTGNRELKVTGDQDDILVEGWKRVENIGITVLENYMKEFLFRGSHLISYDRHGGVNPVIQKKYDSFFGHLYDRYYSGDSVGTAYVEKESKAAYLKKMQGIMNSDMDFAKKQDTLRTEVYNAMSVALFERTPLEFISMEKPRLTQNGVTLMGEIQNHFITAPVESPENMKQKAVFDGSVSDLVYVQQRARMDSVQEMEKIRRDSAKKGDRHNLYNRNGYGEARSEILKDKNGVGGYVVNEAFIKNILEERYKDDPQKDSKISGALKVYHEIKTRVKKMPAHNNEIDTWIPQTEDDPQKQKKIAAEMRIKLANKEKKMDNRMQYWSESWKSYRFGMNFASDTAGQFLDRNRTGADTTARAAEFCANTAEVTKKAFIFEIKGVCKKAALTKDFAPLYEMMKTLKNQVEGQDGDLAQDIMEVLGKRFFNTFMRDKKSQQLLRKYTLRDTVDDRKRSISETYTGSENSARPWSWDSGDALDFLQGAHGMTGGKVINKAKMEALKTPGRARGWDVFKSEILPAIGMASLALIFAALFAGAKVDNK